MANGKWHPGKLFEISGYYWKACTLHAAVKLDVFTCLDDQQLSSDAVAGKLNVAPEGIKRLLNALVAMELLAKSGDQYANTPSSKTFLSKNSSQYLGHMIMHHHHLVESWMHLDQSVQSGKALQQPSAFSDEDRRESFLMGMFNTAMNVAPMLVTEIDLSSRRHLLDLGGGPGPEGPPEHADDAQEGEAENRVIGDELGKLFHRDGPFAGRTDRGWNPGRRKHRSVT